MTSASRRTSWERALSTAADARSACRGSAAADRHGITAFHADGNRAALAGTSYRDHPGSELGLRLSFPSSLMTLPTSHDLGTGPQNLLSFAAPRLSPIMK